MELEIIRSISRAEKGPWKHCTLKSWGIKGFANSNGKWLAFGMAPTSRKWVELMHPKSHRPAWNHRGCTSSIASTSPPSCPHNCSFGWSAKHGNDQRNRCRHGRQPNPRTSECCNHLQKTVVEGGEGKRGWKCGSLQIQINTHINTMKICSSSSF